MNGGGVIVSVFFFISGYGLLKSYREKGKEYLSHFIRRRIVPILLPFILSILLFHIANIFLFQMDYGEMIPNLLVGDTKIILPTSWFVFAIFIVYFGFYYIAKKTSSIQQLVLLFGVATFAFMITSKFVLNWGGFWRMSTFALPLGMIIAYKETMIKKYISENLNKTTFLMMLFLLIVLLLVQFNCLSLYLYLSSICLPLAILLVTYLLGKINLSFLNNIGKISLEVYLVQGMVTFFGRQYFNDDTTYLFTSIVLSILFAQVLHSICNLILDNIKK